MTHTASTPATMCLLGLLVLAGSLQAQQDRSVNEDVQGLVGRLDLQRYRSTIEALSGFGDRRQGTRRNRDAVDWIEAELRSYGCADVERITYEYVTPQRNAQLVAAPPQDTSAPDPFKGPGGSAGPRSTET